MSGRSNQDKRKRDKHVADLTIRPEESATRWQPPPPEECYDVDPYSWTDGDDKFIIRRVEHASTDDLVEFAVIHETWDRGRFRKVCMADSCNHDDVHVHYYSRKDDARVGERERLLEVVEREHLDAGYMMASDAVIERAAENKRRWRDA